MNEQEEGISLANLLDGLAVERFDRELVKVLANIMDPNTPATAKREVVLKVSIKPDQSRDLSAVHIHVASKLAAAEKASTRLFISRTRNGLVATEHNPNQPVLPFDGPQDGEQSNVSYVRPV